MALVSSIGSNRDRSRSNGPDLAQEARDRSPCVCIGTRDSGLDFLLVCGRLVSLGVVLLWTSPLKVTGRHADWNKRERCLLGVKTHREIPCLKDQQP